MRAAARAAPGPCLYTAGLPLWHTMLGHNGAYRVNIVEIIKSDLLNKIGKNKNDEVNVALDYASNFGIRFDRDFLSDLLRKGIRQGTDRPLIARLRDLIRRAHTA
ncbi:hypothetical protein J4558_20400 [Leptolyngbya sp. 15MV]|nr:hypothetical protein J4558_20400 [Leptolyngbya sp. 15MV]